MDERIRTEGRLAGENPYFYLILIGDLHLDLDEPKKALQNYLEAHSRSVAHELVVSRIRRVALYYSERSNYAAALNLLATFRELDAEIFDATIDRIHRESVKSEQDSL